MIGPSFCHTWWNYEAENAQVEVKPSTLEENAEREEEEYYETEDNCSNSIVIKPPPKCSEKPVQKLFPCLECAETFINKQFLRAHTRWKREAENSQVEVQSSALE